MGPGYYSKSNYEIGNTSNWGLVYQKSRQGFGWHRLELNWQNEAVNLYYRTDHKRENETYTADYKVNRIGIAYYPVKIPLQRDQFEILLGLQYSAAIGVKTDLINQTSQIIDNTGMYPIWGQQEHIISNSDAYTRKGLLSGIGVASLNVPLEGKTHLQLEYKFVLDLQSYHTVFSNVWRGGHSLGLVIHFDTSLAKN